MTQSLGEFTDSMLSLGVSRVVWIAGPVPLPSPVGGEDQQGQPDRHDVLHHVMATVASTRPAARVVDLAGWIETSSLNTDPDTARAARVDGVHWSNEASELIATEFLGNSIVYQALT